VSYEAQIKAAKTPQEGMAVIGRALDDITVKLAAYVPASTSGWDVGWAADDPDSSLLTVEEDADGNVTVVLAGASHEKYETRKRFAEEVLQLHHHIDSEGDIFHAYGVAGPMWLYTGNRELFMSYDPTVRALMVQDVEEDDPKAAYDMGKDVLKSATPGELPADWTSV